MSSRALVLEREEEVSRHIQSLNVPILPPAPSLSSPHSTDEITQKSNAGPSAWSVDRWVRAHAAALRALHALRAEVNEGSAASAATPGIQADEVAFWRRRAAEVNRLGQELLQASQARRKHSEQAAALELLGSSTQTSSGNRKSSSNRSSYRGHGQVGVDAIEEARSITEALRRTHGMMGNTLTQAQDSREVLEEDGRLLRGTFDQHLAIGKNVSRASRVLRQIQRQDQVDWWLMFGTTCFFVLVLLYVTLPRVPGLVTLAGMSGRMSRNAFGSSTLNANQTSILLPEQKQELAMDNGTYETIGGVEESNRLPKNFDEHPAGDLSTSNAATVEVSNIGEVLDAGGEALGTFVSSDVPVPESGDTTAGLKFSAKDLTVEVGVAGQVTETSTGDNVETRDVVHSGREVEAIRSNNTIDAAKESEHASIGNDFAFSTASDTNLNAEAEGASSFPLESDDHEKQSSEVGHSPTIDTSSEGPDGPVLTSDQSGSAGTNIDITTHGVDPEVPTVDGEGSSAEEEKPLRSNRIAESVVPTQLRQEPDLEGGLNQKSPEL